jgi:hypothetical protein
VREPGYCAAGGTYGNGGAFVISEQHGIWGTPVTPAGLPNPAKSQGATVGAVGCPPRVALCLAGGNDTPVNSDRAQAFLVAQAR